ncbi:MAG TPA: hypothetical protein VHZ97_06295, partial [Pseudonocardiaceae bacterium]|nr:hypothetical protein [Pseudonocardiaceae bacterium]
MPEQLEFHALTFVDEPEGVMVGRVGADSYFLFPADGAALLRQLADGMTPAKAERWYASCFGETVDITDFLATLDELGLIATGDAPSAPTPVGFQRLGRAIFSPVALACYLAVVAGAVVELVLLPALLPRPGDVFFTSSLIVTQLVLAALQVPLVGWHELFHVLAGRRLGVPSRLGITRRWFFVVFETELNGLLGVPRRSRYLPFLAGMMADAVLFGVLTLILTTLVDPASLAGRVLLAVRVVLVMRLIWQFFV